MYACMEGWMDDQINGWMDRMDPVQLLLLEVAD